MKFESALAILGEHPLPVGTLEELKASGLNPAKCGSCSAQSPTNRGCAFHTGKGGQPGPCIFNNPRFGGFKDQGPKRIGVYIKLAAADGGGQQQMSMSCHTFISCLKPRMMQGQIQRMNGEDGETIRIIAQEGGIIRPRILIQTEQPSKENPNGKWETKKNPDGGFYEETVAAFPRPSEIDANNYEQMLWAEEAKRRMIEDGAFLEPVVEEGPLPGEDILVFDEPLDGENAVSG